IGEEGTPSAAQQAPRVWLVDPICGTANYAAALPLFATNIALLEDGQIVAAGVADGGTGDVCVAEAGRGAWLVDAAGLLPIVVHSSFKMVSVDPDILGRNGIAAFPR